MTPIDHAFLDRYEAAGGEPTREPLLGPDDAARWEAVDALLLELHMVQHGYARDGYDRHLEREMERLCADATVVARLRTLRL